MVRGQHSCCSSLLVGAGLCFLQNALLAGLDGFYRSYVASESDTRYREEEDAAITTSFYSCIRPEYRGAVRIYALLTMVVFETGAQCQREACVAWHVPIDLSGHVLPRQHECTEPKALPPGAAFRIGLELPFDYCTPHRIVLCCVVLCAHRLLKSVAAPVIVSKIAWEFWATSLPSMACSAQLEPIRSSAGWGARSLSHSSWSL